MQTLLAINDFSDAGVGGAIYLVIFLGIALVIAVMIVWVLVKTIRIREGKPDRVWKNPYYDDEHQSK